MVTPPTREALDAERRRLVADMDVHVHKMLDEGLPRPDAWVQQDQARRSDAKQPNATFTAMYQAPLAAR
jgi:hypothetical protein